LPDKSQIPNPFYLFYNRTINFLLEIARKFYVTKFN